MNIKTLGFSLSGVNLGNLTGQVGYNNILKDNSKKEKVSKEPAAEDNVRVEIDGYNSKTEASSDKKSSNKLKTEEPKSEDSKIEGITVTTDMPDSIPTPPKNGVSKTSLDGAVSYTKVVVDSTVDDPEGPTYQEIIKYDDGTIIVNTYQGDKLSMSVERNFEDEEGNPIDPDNPDYGDRSSQKMFFYDEDGNVTHVHNDRYEYTSEGWGDFLVGSIADDIFYDEEGNPIYKGDIGWQERYREYIKSVNEFGLAQEIRKQSLIDY